MEKSSHQLRIPDDVANLIRRMHPLLKRKVRASLHILLADTHAGKSLKDKLAGFWSLRVSRFRIIYRFSSKVIEIVAIGPRDRIYEDVVRIVRKLER